MDDESAPLTPMVAVATPGDTGAEKAQGSGSLSWQARAVVVFVAVCAVAALFWPRDEQRSAPPGMLVDTGGRPIPIGSRMAPVTLVHFWATWCPPCITEIPSILRLADHYTTNHDFALLMIAVQDDIEKVQPFLGARADESLFDHQWKVAKDYGTSKLPETHLVVEGEIVHSFIGATDWDAPENRRRIAEALASRQVASE